METLSATHSYLDLAVSSHAVARLGLLPKSWVCFLVGIEQKDTTKK